MKNPMAYSHSLAIGSLVMYLAPCVFKIVPHPSSQNVYDLEKLTIVGKVLWGCLAILTTA